MLNSCLYFLWCWILTGCKYERGKWSACQANGQRERIDTLVEGSGTECEATRTKTKPCKQKQKNGRYYLTVA